MNNPDSGKNIGLRQSIGYFVRLLKLIRPYWRSLGKGIILGPVIGLLAVVTPFLTKLLFDSVYPTGSITLMEVIVLGILVVSMASALADTALQYYSSYINAKLDGVFNLHFLNHLQHLPTSFFVKHQVGEIKSRFADGESALTAIVSTIQVLFGQGIYILLVPPFLFFLHWKLALIAIIAIPITALITFYSGKYMRSTWKDVAEAHADFDALQVEVLNQVQTFKGLGLEHYNFKRGSTIQQKALKAHLRAHSVHSAVSVSDRLLNALNIALFTWLGWRYIIQGEMSLGDYVAFTAYIGYMYGPFSTLISMFTSFQQAAVNLDRVYEYLDHPPEQDPTQAYETPPEIQVRLTGEVTLADVSFFYQPDQPVLKQVNIHLEAGKLHGLVGFSGSGKTTLLRLLSQFEKPASGSIRFDGIDAEKIPLIDFRRQIAIVWQEVQLIKGTIWENLTLGLEAVDMQEVTEIVRIAQLQEFINSLPEGYETPIAEWGNSMSGGQRQRFAVARALIRKPRLLILDEATSNLDVRTESAMIAGLSAFTRWHSITTVFVTHRVRNLINADHIYVLDKGTITGKGRYTQLAETSPQFAEMITPADAEEALSHESKPISTQE
ncbi:MAG: peptidase domain-containing ABC transporter [Roseivirga sp.]